MLAESLVEILKFIARSNFRVPPPARQAAARWLQCGESDVGRVPYRKESVTRKCSENNNVFENVVPLDDKVE